MIPLLAVGPALSLVQSLTDSASSASKKDSSTEAKPATNGAVMSFGDILSAHAGKIAK